MPRYILTGAPGSGKTSLLRHLANRGYMVVEEAATEVITAEQEKGILEPWENLSFAQKILDLQIAKQAQDISLWSQVQFFDRSPLDTYALCKHMKYPVSSRLLEEIKEVQTAGGYEKDVFFLDNLGFIEPSEARKISFEESLSFERIHRELYDEWGYHCIDLPRQSIEERAVLVMAYLKERADLK